MGPDGDGQPTPDDPASHFLLPSVIDQDDAGYDVSVDTYTASCTWARSAVWLEIPRHASGSTSTANTIKHCACSPSFVHRFFSHDNFFRMKTPWSSRLEIVRPFDLPIGNGQFIARPGDTDIDVLDIYDLEKAPPFRLSYASDRTAGQFRVFRNRTLLPIAGSLVYGCGVFGLLALRVVAPVYTIYRIVCGLLIILCSIVDLAVFLTFELTPAVARVRECLGVASGVFVTGICSWIVPQMMASCADGVDLLKWIDGVDMLHLARSDAIGTLVRRCLGAPQVFKLSLPAAIVIISPLHPAAVAAILALQQVLFWAVGEPLVADHIDDLRDLGPNVLVDIVCYLGAVILSFVRFRHEQRVFDDVVRLAAATQATERCNTDLHALTMTLVPPAVQGRLLARATNQVDMNPDASVLYADMQAFTSWSSKRTAMEVAMMLNIVVAEVDRAAWQSPGLEKIKTVGDAYWAVCGLPLPVVGHADIMCDFACKFVRIVRLANDRHLEWDGVYWRLAVHSGPLSGALIGTQQVSYEVFGHTLHIVQAAEAAGVADAVLVTEAMYSASRAPRHKVRMVLTPQPLQVKLDGRTDIIRMYKIDVARPRRKSFCPDRKRISGVSATNILAGPGVQRSAVAESGHNSNFNLYSFLMRRSCSAELDTETDKVSLSELTARISRRRWRFGILQFADPFVESLYSEFIVMETAPVAFATSTISTAVSVFIFAAHFIQSGVCESTAAIPFEILSMLLFVVVAVLSAARGTAIWHRWSTTSDPRSTVVRWAPVFSIIIANVAVTVNIVGDYLAGIGGCLVGADPAFIVLVFSSFTLCLLGPLSWQTMFAIQLLCQCVPTLVVTWTMPTRSLTWFLTLCVVVFWFLFCRLYEPLLRRRFVEVQLAEELDRRAEKQNRSLTTVLEAVVPRHIVPALVPWFLGGLDPAKAPSRQYPAAVVGFVELRAPVGSDATGEWMPAMHAAVDDRLAELALVTKVKTVGDILMIGGPFGEDSTTPTLLGAACVEAVRAVDLIAELSVRSRAGIHCGNVVGTVQGSSRLCFDIFGDTVNVASRVMTAQEEGNAAVSSLFSDACHGAPDVDGLAGVVTRFREDVSFEAKGAGTVVAFRLASAAFSAEVVKPLIEV